MFDFFKRLLSPEDFVLAGDILGDHGLWREPDLVIAPDGVPYLYRWHVVPQNDHGNVYFHIQVASDPERPLHDHPWANTSVILSGGYDEIYDQAPERAGRLRNCGERQLRKGDVVHRAATEAHRLILPSGIAYTMTLFTTGPKVRDWGFWFPDGWRKASTVTHMEGQKSVMNAEARDE